MPRRSGTTTVWSFASLAAIGDHMSPVLPKPWISTTAGPCPPTRTWIVASAFTTCKLRKPAGKGVGAACADRAPSVRLAARLAATRWKRRENVDETVADILGSLGNRRQVLATASEYSHPNKERKPFILRKSERNTTLERLQHLMNEGDGNRSFADGGRHALDVAAPHVADREDSGTIRFQQIRRSCQP